MTTRVAQLRRARAAVSAVFLINGVLFANLVPRLPAVKDQLDLTNSAFGAAIAAAPAGALLSGLLAPLLIRWFGSAKVASLGLVLMGVAIVGVPFAQSWLALAAILLVVGALDALIDVAQNAHAFRVQRAYGRSIVNAFHGLWSVGAVTGGLIGSAAAGLAVPLSAHLIAISAIFGVVALVAYRFLLPGPEDAERDPTGAHAATPADLWQRSRVRGPVLALAGLGLVAICGGLVEDAGSSWGALFMRDEVGTGPAVGGLAFVALMTAMTIGRLTGDRVVDRWGQRRVAQLGGIVAAMGMGLALAWPAIPTAIVGFALAGLGVATTIPAAMHVADEVPGLRAGVGLTVVTWLLRVGFLVSPVVVGIVADAASLRVALLGVVAAGLAVALLGRLLGPRTHQRHGAAVAVTGSPASPPVASNPGHSPHDHS